MRFPYAETCDACAFSSFGGFYAIFHLQTDPLLQAWALFLSRSRNTMFSHLLVSMSLPL